MKSNLSFYAALSLAVSPVFAQGGLTTLTTSTVMTTKSITDVKTEKTTKL